MAKMDLGEVGILCEGCCFKQFRRNLRSYCTLVSHLSFAASPLNRWNPFYSTKKKCGVMPVLVKCCSCTHSFTAQYLLVIYLVSLLSALTSFLVLKMVEHV